MPADLRTQLFTPERDKPIQHSIQLYQNRLQHAATVKIATKMNSKLKFYKHENEQILHCEFYFSQKLRFFLNGTSQNAYRKISFKRHNGPSELKL